MCLWCLRYCTQSAHAIRRCLLLPIQHTGAVRKTPDCVSQATALLLSSKSFSYSALKRRIPNCRRMQMRGCTSCEILFTVCLSGITSFTFEKVLKKIWLRPCHSPTQCGRLQQVLHKIFFCQTLVAALLFTLTVLARLAYQQIHVRCCC